MLRDRLSGTGKLVSHGFLVYIETEDNVPYEALEGRLTDACAFIEGVGHTDVTYMGQMEDETETVS